MTRKQLCKLLDKHIRDEQKGADEYYTLLGKLTKEHPELRNPIFSETFSKLLPYSEKTHAEYLTSIKKLLRCPR